MLRNRGSSYKFILNRLPHSPSEIFVDASSSWGIGGLYGDRYFLLPRSSLRPFDSMYAASTTHRHNIECPVLPIAYLELLAAMIAVVTFAPFCADKIIRLNCDNSDAVSWLQKSRCSAGIGFRFLTVVELYKHKYRFKISTCHISGVGNTSADQLSRGAIPKWLKMYGSRFDVNVHLLVDLLSTPLKAWKRVLLMEPTSN